MTNDEKIDGLDAIIEDLIEWELEDMLAYREQYKATEIVQDNE